MDRLVWTLATNAVLASALAMFALAVSRLIARPAVAHALWSLVLIKLLMPPLVPLPVFERPAAAIEVAVAPTAQVGAAPGEMDEPGALPPLLAPVPRPAAAKVGASSDVALTLAGVLLVLGALTVLFMAWRRARAFRSLTAGGRPAGPALQQRVDDLAAELGLPRGPTAWLVAARLSPLTWWDLDGLKLVLPAGLWRTLTPAERDTLLLHELAHVRRRDHWVRYLELLTSALFWWYPLVWWARKKLRQAEERSCDEWVLRLRPRAARDYAQGLVKTVAYMSVRSLPAQATGAGEARELKGRVEEILMERPSRDFTNRARAAWSGAALAALLVYPTWAEEETEPARVIEVPDAPEAPRPTNAPKLADVPTPVVVPAPAASEPARPAAVPEPGPVPRPALVPAEPGSPRPAVAPRPAIAVRPAAGPPPAVAPVVALRPASAPYALDPSELPAVLFLAEANFPELEAAEREHLHQLFESEERERAALGETVERELAEQIEAVEREASEQAEALEREVEAEVAAVEREVTQQTRQAERAVEQASQREGTADEERSAERKRALERVRVRLRETHRHAEERIRHVHERHRAVIERARAAAERARHELEERRAVLKEQRAQLAQRRVRTERLRRTLESRPIETRRDAMAAQVRALKRLVERRARQEEKLTAEETASLEKVRKELAELSQEIDRQLAER